MKKLLLCTLASVVVFTACSVKGDNTVEKISNTRFQHTGNMYSIDSSYWREYVDTETNNLYIINVGSYGGGLCPLYDEDGNIAKYNR